MGWGPHVIDTGAATSALTEVNGARGARSQSHRGGARRATWSSAPEYAPASAGRGRELRRARVSPTELQIERFLRRSKAGSAAHLVALPV
jgi:hypothetical protein